MLLCGLVSLIYFLSFFLCLEVCVLLNFVCMYSGIAWGFLFVVIRLSWGVS